MTELISLKFNLNVSKEDVRMTLVKVDPIGVEIRRNKTIKRRIYQTNGPMDILHIDGNDKLKRFGFAIHGCIDGFSRKLLWLNVSTTNNNPLVIANYYINCVSTFKKPHDSSEWIKELKIFTAKISKYFGQNQNQVT